MERHTIISWWPIYPTQFACNSHLPRLWSGYGRSKSTAENSLVYLDAATWSAWAGQYLASNTQGVAPQIYETDISIFSSTSLKRNKPDFHLFQRPLDPTIRIRISLSSYNNSPLFSLTSSTVCNGDFLRHFSGLRAEGLHLLDEIHTLNNFTYKNVRLVGNDDMKIESYRKQHVYHRASQLPRWWWRTGNRWCSFQHWPWKEVRALCACEQSSRLN